MQTRWIEVIETPGFQRSAGKLFAPHELEELIEYLARNPDAGVVIAETGGIRKLRWGSGGKGKRGGARVIYYYRNERFPLYLVSAYSKSRQKDLSPEQVRTIRRLVADL